MTERSTRLLDQLFRSLNEGGVCWSLLRGGVNLGRGHDVDLLVLPEHLPAFEEIVFEYRGVMLPANSHPWHRFYLVPDPAGRTVLLDVVTRLIYNRGLRLDSQLAGGCLARRVRDGEVFVLNPTDTFWTVLLHSLLDKPEVSDYRAAELVSLVEEIRRPSPGEEFVERLCPAGLSADRVIGYVQHRDWASLAALRRALVPGEQVSIARPPKRFWGLRPALGVAKRSAYQVLWRRAGLGAVPRVVDLVEAARVEATILSVRRRPGLCDVLLLVPEDQQRTLESALRGDRYLAAGGGWSRLTGVGLERVSLRSEPELVASGQSPEQIRDSALPVGGRKHLRRAVPESRR